MTETVEFRGYEWRIGERVGLMPMMRYARATKQAMQKAKAGTEPDGLDELEGLDATLALLEQCVHPDDWDRFEAESTAAGFGQEDYMEFAGRVMAVLAARPTGRSSDSSDGPHIIEPSSTGDSSSPATDRVVQKLNDKGRPDLALLVRRREESLSA